MKIQNIKPFFKRKLRRKKIMKRTRHETSILKVLNVKKNKERHLY
jgi:hypothetical protein